MKFVASKKLSNNLSLRLVMIWMVFSLTIALGLNLVSKSIDYGTSPSQWSHTVLGNPEEFTDPMSLNDILLAVHTDLFTLILIYILLASLYVRSSHPTSFKISFLSFSLAGLILYPTMLISAFWIGTFGVKLAGSAFILFHTLMLLVAFWLLVALLRRKI
ncbi:MAG: hypothetical protein PHO27_06085 [Sulfuricurvum sp.]|nr:hypothetical protein [Sulfuricurvum sp.]